MKSKGKVLAVPGIPGVPGPAKDPMEKLCASVNVSSRSLSGARACEHMVFPGTPGTVEEKRENLSVKKEKNPSPPQSSEPGAERGQRGQAQIDHDEALDLPVGLWAELPIPSSVRVRLGSGRVLWLTASRGRAQEARAAGEACFAPVEYEALAVGLLGARVSQRELDAWTAHKAREPGWMLGAHEAVASAVGLLAPEHRAGSLARTTMRQLVALMDGTAEAVLVETTAAASRAANDSAMVGALEAM